MVPCCSRFFSRDFAYLTFVPRHLQHFFIGSFILHCLIYSEPISISNSVSISVFAHRPLHCFSSLPDCCHLIRLYSWLACKEHEDLPPSSLPYVQNCRFHKLNVLWTVIAWKDQLLCSNLLNEDAIRLVLNQIPQARETVLTFIPTRK